MSTLIKNIKLITPNEVLTGYGVVFENDKIIKLDLEENIPEDSADNIIDGNGEFLSPGFIDIHNHGNSGYDFMDGTEEAVDAIGAYHIKNGVTSYLGTVLTSTENKIFRAVNNLAQYKNKDNLSQLIGIHLEGPFLSKDKKGAQPKKYIIRPNLDFMIKLNEISQGKIRMVSLAPEIDGSDEIISYLESKKISVAMAHTNAKYIEVQKALNEGATIATHLFNGMREFNHREPGIVGASLTDKRVYCEIIYDRIHLHDVAVQIALKMKGADKLILISDAMRASGLHDGIYELGGQTVYVNNKAACLEDGNLAGSTLNIRQAVYNMVYYLKVPISDAVRMASLTPATAIKEDKHKGSIQVGKDADMLLFDKDINISIVIMNGKIIDF